MFYRDHPPRKARGAAGTLGALCLACGLLLAQSAHAPSALSAQTRPEHTAQTGPAVDTTGPLVGPATRALDSERPEPAPTGKKQVWYGWQTLSVDAASIALVVAQAATELTPTVLGVGGLATFLLGSPIVLLAHDSPWSMPSFLVRLASAGLMVGGAAIALGGGCFVVFGEEPAGCGTRQVVGGVMMLAGLFGVPAAIALDAMFARQARAQAHRPPPVSVWADPTHGALGLSVSVPQSL